ncbi:hypothetical protein HYX16_06400 [Candidatus Woesearchaeota archaeon]|nr:hypothetical protein [Candidatus Woesearchaeota archaeon]
MGKINAIDIVVKKNYPLYGANSYDVGISGYESVTLLGIHSVRSYITNAIKMLRRNDTLNRYNLVFFKPINTWDGENLPEKDKKSLEKVIEEMNNEEANISGSPYENQE